MPLLLSHTHSLTLSCLYQINIVHRSRVEDKSFLSTKVPHLGVGSLGRKEVDFRWMEVLGGPYCTIFLVPTPMIDGMYCMYLPTKQEVPTYRESDT